MARDDQRDWISSQRLPAIMLGGPSSWAGLFVAGPALNAVILVVLNDVSHQVYTFVRITRRHLVRP
jgi:hypothetical protein